MSFVSFVLIQMLIKICGITRFDDAEAAVEQGAHALGFVFWPESPRFIDPYRARAIAARLPPFVATVGVFVNQALEYVGLLRRGVTINSNLFGSTFFTVTGFHGLHVSIGVIYLTTIAFKVKRGDYERKGNYEVVEIAGLYWHFVDLVWVFIFAFFYLW